VRPLLIAIFLLITHGAHALGREFTLDEIVSKHFNQVNWITTCGTWQSREQSGVYRIIHASLYAQSVLYAQWIRISPDGKNEVQHTASIAELNNDHADVQLEKLRCQTTKTGVTIQSTADFGHEGKSGTVQVVLFQTPGKYQFRRRVPRK
jgi:hypothetical protein